MPRTPNWSRYLAGPEYANTRNRGQDRHRPHYAPAARFEILEIRHAHFGPPIYPITGYSHRRVRNTATSFRHPGQ
jgi:hypothetical protein